MSQQFYNYSYPDTGTGTNVSSPGALLTWANQQTQYGFGVGVLMAFFLVMLLQSSYYQLSLKKGFATASFVSAILAILARSIELVSDTVVMISILLVIISVAWLFSDD